MRPKFLATILLLAALATGAVVFLKSRLATPPPVAVSPPPQPPQPPPTPLTPPTPQTPPTAPTSPTPPFMPPTPPAPAVVLTDEQRQAAIEAEKAKLQDWQGNDDSASYSNILKDLTHPEKEVRLAALEALKQFGGTNAIPVLKDLAAKTDDLDEAKELLDTARFLSLPPADLNSFFHHPSPNASGSGVSQ